MKKTTTAHEKMTFFFVLLSGGGLFNLFKVSIHNGHNTFALETEVSSSFFTLHFSTIRVPLISRHADELFIGSPGLHGELVDEDGADEATKSHQSDEDLLLSGTGDTDFHSSGHEVSAGGGGLLGDEGGSRRGGSRDNREVATEHNFLLMK